MFVCCVGGGGFKEKHENTKARKAKASQAKPSRENGSVDWWSGLGSSTYRLAENRRTSARPTLRRLSTYLRCDGGTLAVLVSSAVTSQVRGGVTGLALTSCLSAQKTPPPLSSERAERCQLSRKASADRNTKASIECNPAPAGRYPRCSALFVPFFMSEISPRAPRRRPLDLPCAPAPGRSWPTRRAPLSLSPPVHARNAHQEMREA